MALRTIHHIAGQSNCIGNASKGDLTDTRYEITDADVQQILKANSDAVIGPQTMDLPASFFGADAPIGHRRKAAGEALPLTMRYGFSGTNLAVSWRPYVNSGNYVTYHSTWWERYNHCRLTAFPGDTFEHRSWTWIQGESDATDHARALAYEANLRQLVEIVRHDLSPNLPFFIVRLSSSYTADGAADPADVALVRDAADAVAASMPRVYSISADAVPLQSDATHYTADGLMMLGDLIADAMAADGLAGVEQYTRVGRTFTSLANAQTFSGAAQTALGARDENPANGGFGVRGPGARDPWPTTARSVVHKHPYRNEWLVPVDPAMEADGSLDTDTDLRPVDGDWWRYA